MVPMTITLATVALKTAYAEAGKVSAKSSAAGQKGYSDSASAGQSAFASATQPVWLTYRKGLAGSAWTLAKSASAAEVTYVHSMTTAASATTVGVTASHDAYADAIRDGETGVRLAGAAQLWRGTRHGSRR